MENVLMTKEEIQNALGQLSYREIALQQQMGLLDTECKRIGTELRTVKEKQDDNYREFKEYKALQAERERIDSEEQNDIKQSVDRRVTDLCRASDRFDLFGVIARKLWCDLKKHSCLRGRGGYDTKRMHYKEVLSYIGTWEPYGYGGISGYITHIDDERKRSGYYR